MNFKRIASFFILLSFFIVGQSIGADKYNIDTSHSEVGFSVSHLVLSKTRGNFNKFSGVIMYDETDIANSSVDVSIETVSVDTDDEDRDSHLREKDFFDVEKFPAITFKSKEVVEKKNDLIMIGDLTIRDITREIEIPFTFNGKIVDPWGHTRIGAEAQLVINRQDFGITWSKTMDSGGLVVGNDIKIELQIEAVLEK